MAITLELTAEEERRWHEAKARGIDMKRLVKGLMQSLTWKEEPEKPQVLTGQAWQDVFDAYIASRLEDTPLLSDEAMSRETMYGERG